MRASGTLYAHMKRDIESNDHEIENGVRRLLAKKLVATSYTSIGSELGRERWVKKRIGRCSTPMKSAAARSRLFSASRARKDAFDELQPESGDAYGAQQKEHGVSPHNPCMRSRR